MNYPEFACKCCGIANGDMYYDWYKHKYGKEPDEAAWETFNAYRDLYNARKEYKHWNDKITDGKPLSSVEWISRYRKLKAKEASCQS